MRFLPIALITMQKHGPLESEWDSQIKANQLLQSFQGFANKVYNTFVTCNTCIALQRNKPNCLKSDYSQIFESNLIKLYGDSGEQPVWWRSRQLRCYGLAYWPKRTCKPRLSQWPKMGLGWNNLGNFTKFQTPKIGCYSNIFTMFKPGASIAYAMTGQVCTK